MKDIYTFDQHFNSHPHEEDDLMADTARGADIYFNSHPHEEDDGLSFPPCLRGYISTHILTKRMTVSDTINKLA